MGSSVLYALWDALWDPVSSMCYESGVFYALWDPVSSIRYGILVVITAAVTAPMQGSGR